MAPNDSLSYAATATVDAGTGTVKSIHLSAGSDAAVATLRTGGSGGTVLTRLSCGANEHDFREWEDSVPYSNLHLTISGTLPLVDVELGGL
jgi:hypothetical protein